MFGFSGCAAAGVRDSRRKVCFSTRRIPCVYQLTENVVLKGVGFDKDYDKVYDKVYA